MGFQTLESIERRRRNIRILLFTIILGTLPFYCAGFFLWGTSRPRSASLTAEATFTPIGADSTITPVLFPSLTPLFFTTATSISPLQPTPLQFVPPVRPPVDYNATATFFAFPTSVFIPTATSAPTLTPFPTDIPLPTQTPLPTDIPLPPLPTEAPPPTVEVPIVPPTDVPASPTSTATLTITPLPFDTLAP